MATADKAALRLRLLTARRSVSDDIHADESLALCGHIDALMTSANIVCAYVPVGTEPGSIELLDVLLRRTERVLLPVARTTDDDTPLPMRWGEYRPGLLVPGRFGLLEPPEPWLPASALTDADHILVPALAVDRQGVRLGRGRGFYDRSLPARDPQVRLIAVIRDQELVDELPAEPHDVLMTHALTPRGGLMALGTRRAVPE